MATTIITTIRNTVSERGSVPKYIRVSTPVYSQITQFNTETQRWESVEDTTNIVKHDYSYVPNPAYNTDEIWSHPDNYKNNVTESENTTIETEE